MAMPKKSSRPIKVDGVPYRWSARKMPDQMVVLVEDEVLGRMFTAILRVRDWYRLEGVEQRERIQDAAVTPGIVKQLIQYALKNSWPEKGMTKLRGHEDPLSFDEFVLA